MASEPGAATQDLWITNGTTAGTLRLTSLGSATDNSHLLTNVNGTLFFRGFDAVHGHELWKSTGTLEGTQMTRDLRPGTADSELTDPVAFNGMLLFSANGHLSRSNGTASGTIRVMDLLLSANDEVGELITAGNFVCFRAKNLQGSMSLFRTDGTGQGTQAIAGGFRGLPSELTNVAGTLYFVDSLHSLWKANPQNPANAALLVRDSSVTAISPTQLTNVSGVLYFESSGSLWKSSGTTAGTSRIKFVGAQVAELFNMNGVLFFSGGTAEFGFGYELWKSDGTASGTLMVKDIDDRVAVVERFGYSSSPQYFVNAGGTLVFHAAGGLWKTDGTLNGTVALESGVVSGPALAGEALYFATSTNSQSVRSLAKRPLTASAAISVARSGAGTGDSNPASITSHLGELYFTADDGVTGTELWKLRNEGPPVQVVDLVPGAAGSQIADLHSFNGLLYFTAKTQSRGKGLWVTNGTAAGTRQLGSFDGMFVSSSTGQMFTSAGSNLFFTALANEGVELWKSDGTVSGTVIVSDLYPGFYEDNFGHPVAASSGPSNLTNVNGRLYFSARNGDAGRELWTSDGTAAGTAMVRDLFSGETYSYSGIPNDSSPGSFVKHLGTLFFTASTGGSRGLWKSDGTSAGTQLIAGGTESLSSTRGLLSTGDGLYFLGTNAAQGEELWITDGTAAGTRLVRDISPGSQSSLIRSMTAANGLLYFVADDGLHGQELWQSDGTATGTRLVRDINPGSDPGTGQPRNSSPSGLINVNGVLFFSADDGLSGRELWRNNGTAVGAVRVADLTLNSPGSSPDQFALHNGQLYFSAATTNGRELWKVSSKAPMISLQSAPVIWQEGSRPARFALTAQVSDLDTPFLNGGVLTIRMTNIAPGDQLLFESGTPITITQNQITFRSTVVGTLVVRSEGTDLTVRLNQNASPAAVQALLRSAAFVSTSENPVASDRRIRIELLDGESAASTARDYVVRVVAVNDRPVITGLPRSIDYISNSQPGSLIASEAILQDPDDDYFGGGLLTVSLAGSDVARARLQISGPLLGTNSAGDVLYQGLIIGRMNSGGGTGVIPLEIRLLSTARRSMVQNLIRSLRYSTTGVAGTGRHRVTMTIFDSQLAVSAAVSVLVNIREV